MAKRIKRKLKKQYNRPKDLKNYNDLKVLLKNFADRFYKEDDMFFLIECMVAGTKILEKNGFPIKEFIKYKYEKK